MDRTRHATLLQQASILPGIDNTRRPAGQYRPAACRRKLGGRHFVTLYQLLPALQWLKLLLAHIPDKYEHLVRYYGWYNNRVRGERNADMPCALSPSSIKNLSFDAYSYTCDCGNQLRNNPNTPPAAHPGPMARPFPSPIILSRTSRE